MTVYVYTGGQRKVLVDPKAYPDAVSRDDIQVIYAYDGGQRYLVWERQPLAASATATAWNSITVSWSGPGGGVDDYVLKRGSTVIYTGTATSKVDGSRSASTTYTYTVQARRGGEVIASTTASAKTSARPTTQKVVTLNADWLETWRGNKGYRTDNAYTYHGYDSYVGPGYYRSLIKFPIPSDVRNCKSVDKVEIRFYNKHTYNGTGADYYLGWHGYVNKPASGSFPTTNRKTWIHVNKPGWYGWANHTKAFATALRTGGMDGYSFGPGTSTNVSQYGYADSVLGNHLMRITYTVFV